MAWARLATKTLTSAGDTITTDTFTASKFNQMLTHAIQSGNIVTAIRLGNTSIDTGNNYARRRSTNGGADDLANPQAAMYTGGGTSEDLFQVAYLINISTEEKLAIIFRVDRNASGAGNSPSRREMVAKWSPTVIQATSGDESGIGFSQEEGGWGQKFASGHTLVGKKCYAIKVKCRYGVSNSSPAQNMICRHYGSTPSTIRATADATISTSILTTSFQELTFTFANPVAIQADDHIMITIQTDGGSGNWNCDIAGSSTDANMNFTTWNNSNSSFTEQTHRELLFTIFTAPQFDLAQSYNDETGDYATDSNLMVIGSDGTPTSQTWQNGLEFHETDTNKDYVWNSSTNAWIQIT